jgi:sugar phosphate isomerase/epimerase
MHLDYSISLWNFTHYSKAPSLERTLAMVRERGWGIELWANWRDEADLYDATGLKRVKNALAGMRVSLHTAVVSGFAAHCKQIDAAAEVGAQVLVLHPNDLYLPGTKDLDVDVAQHAVEYAGPRRVKLALENGQWPFIAQALDRVPGLCACLDVGHVYLTTATLAGFLDVMKSRLVHLHLQDLALAPSVDYRFPGTGVDHYPLGSGGIPIQDWRLLMATLEEIDFSGTAVFEIQPPNPLQTAYAGQLFLSNLAARTT